MTDMHTPLTANEGAAESALHKAAWSGDLDKVKHLVKTGFDVNWQDSIGETALFGAASWGHIEVVKYLLSVGARHDLHESHGFTPLHWAARGNREMLQLLIEAGADPHAADQFGRLPIDIAHEHGKGANVSYLKTVGPQIASKRKNGIKK
ncbi:MAG: ankyrin repeat domain-containing protein [Pseudomonadota bacterium]